VSKYWKFIIALLTAVAEVGALWADAPHWVLTALPFVGAALVFAKANAPQEPDAVRAVRERSSGV
jgi:hypothetical protein